MTDTSTAIVGGRVVPVEGEPIEGGTVLLRDGKIAAVEGPGFPVPSGAEVVDAAGKWVLPGFIDAHAHVGVSEAQLREAQRIVPIVSVQNRYNVADRRSQSMIDICEQEQLVFLPWAPIQETDKRVAVAVAAERHGATEHQVVLAWLLAISPAILPIPGTGSAGHAEENIAAASLELSPQEIRAISQGG